MYTSVFTLILCIALTQATYVLIDNTKFYDLNPATGELVTKMHARVTGPNYDSLTVDKKNKRMFWKTTYYERWHHYAYDTGYGYSITKDQNYGTPSFNQSDLAIAQVFYDNSRDTLYAITVTKQSGHLDISTISTDSANMTVSTSKISTLDFECFNVLTWFGYDDNTHTFVVLGYCTTEKKNYILRMSIDSGKIVSKVATTITRDFYRDYFFDSTGTILHVVNTNDPYNGTFTSYTLDLKTGSVDKPIVIWDPATEHVLESQWENLCYNPVDNTMLMSAMVEDFDKKWQIHFIVTDLKTGERKSHAKVGFIDIKKMVWI